MRRQFQLPEVDDGYLEGLGRPWETVLDGGGRWLLMHDWPVPTGYNHPTVSAAIRMEQGYPDSPLDMVYLFPHLQRTDGGAIGALSTQPLDGKIWQRWSRHRTDKNPWRVGIDDLSCHMVLVDYWLTREFHKRVA